MARRTETKTTKDQLAELLYQALETEVGGIEVYETALTCAVNEDLKKEWTEYLEQTRKHEQIVRDVFAALGLDPEAETPGRAVVRHIGQSLVRAMEMAREAGEPAAAQIVAAECVVSAETKDHLNWELIGEAVKTLKGEERKALKSAHEEVEEEEDEHLYHSKGWCRELWIEALGMPAVLPPPEEEKHVKTAIGAERARQARKEMLS
jgi:rubrerythrin